MSWSPRIVRPLGGVERTFALRWGEINELEQLAGGTGAPMVHRQIGLQMARRSIIEAVIRLGLVGGGLTDEKELTEIIRRYVREWPAAERDALAYEILGQALYDPDAKAPPEGSASGDAGGNPPPAGANAGAEASPTE